MSSGRAVAASRHGANDASHARSQREQQAPRGGRVALQPAPAAHLSNQAVSRSLGAGAPLPPAVRADMQARFGADFADVRVHDDADAHSSAAALEAKAYTQANHIVFARDRYAPRSAGGIRLLAHELAHVLQQRRGGPAPELDPAAPHERAAEQAANETANGSRSVSVAGSTGVGIAREPDDEPRKTTAAPRTPENELADFTKMLADDFGAKGPLTSDELLQLYRHGSRATVAKYLRQYFMKQAAATGAMTFGDVTVKVKQGVPLDKQVDAFVKNLEGAHSTPQAVGKKLPSDVGKDLPGGKYNPDDALVVLTDKSTHTAMDQPWKDAFDNLRKSGVKQATAQQVFDAVADGIRKTPGMSESEKNSRIARLHDEMFKELGLKPGRKYSIPRIVKWWEILAAKARMPAAKKAPKRPSKVKPTTKSPDKRAKPAAKPAVKPKPPKAAVKPKPPKAAVKPKPPKAAVKPKPPKAAPTPAPKRVAAVKGTTPATPEPPAIKASPKSQPDAQPRKPGKSGAGGVGVLRGVALQILAGWIHQKAVEKRIEQQAKEKGWVPYGSPSGEGWLYDLGAWWMDPSNEADKNVPFEKRFQIAPWRQRIREAANAKKPGEKLDFTWQVGICKQDFMGRWKTVNHEAVYLKNADGRWSKEGGELWGMPSMNDLISEEVPDSQIEKLINADPCYQSDRDYSKGST